MTKRCWSLFSKQSSCSQHGGQMCWHVGGDSLFFLNSHHIRWVSVVCFSSDASSADSQGNYGTVHPKFAIISPTSFDKVYEEVKCHGIFCGWSRGGGAGCRGEEGRFDDWQTLRRHASLVVIRNKHTEQRRKHTFHQSWVRFTEPRRNASLDHLPY